MVDKGEYNALAVLVTGVWGVGRNFARPCLPKDARCAVWCFQTIPDLPRRRQWDRTRHRRPGRSRGSSVELEGVEAVVHLGAAMLFGPRHPALLEANIKGTFHLAHAASQASVRRFVFASSDDLPSLFGEYLPIDEAIRASRTAFTDSRKWPGKSCCTLSIGRAPPYRYCAVLAGLRTVGSGQPERHPGGFLFYEKLKISFEAGPGTRSRRVRHPLVSQTRLLLPRDEAVFPDVPSLDGTTSSRV